MIAPFYFGGWRDGGAGAVGRKEELTFSASLGAAPSINDMEELAVVTAGAQQAELQTINIAPKYGCPRERRCKTRERQAAAIRRMQICDIRAIGEYDDEGRAEKLGLTFFFMILAPWIAVMAIPRLLTMSVVFGFDAFNDMHRCDYINDAEAKTKPLGPITT